MSKLNDEIYNRLKWIYKPIKRYAMNSSLEYDVIEYIILPFNIQISTSVNYKTIVCTRSDENSSVIIYQGRDVNELLDVIAKNIEVS